MVYRVFISTTVDEDSDAYTQTVKQALWQLKDFPVAPMTMADLAKGTQDPEFIIRQTLDDTDIFIGVYATTFGEYEHLNIGDLIEYEYRYAQERGIPTLIFIPADASQTDKQLVAFKQFIKERQIVHSFTNLEDLQAQLVVAVTTQRIHQRKMPPIVPPLSGLRQEQTQPTTTGEFETDVRRAYDLIADDIEDTVRRAITVQDARKQIMPPPLTGGAGHEMTVNPIFGNPNNNIQFQSDIFMITPFREEFDAVYQNVIVPTVTGMNLTIKRGDEFHSVSGQIMSEVWAAINACRLVIVETTQENANVYYELGIAHTLGKPAILITQGTQIEDFPFDIRHLRFIVYKNTIAGGEQLESDLKKSIIRIVNDLDDGE